MPGIIDAVFDPNEAVNIYPIGASIAVPDFYMHFPGRFKLCSDHIHNEINSVRRDTQVQNFFFHFRI